MKNGMEHILTSRTKDSNDIFVFSFNFGDTDIFTIPSFYLKINPQMPPLIHQM